MPYSTTSENSIRQDSLVVRDDVELMLWSLIYSEQGSTVATNYLKYSMPGMDLSKVATVVQRFQSILKGRRKRTKLLGEVFAIPTLQLALQEIEYPLTNSSIALGGKKRYNSEVLQWIRSRKKLPKGTDINKKMDEWFIKCFNEDTKGILEGEKEMTLIHTGCPISIRDIYTTFTMDKHYSSWLINYYNDSTDIQAQGSPQGSCMKYHFGNISYHPVEAYGGKLSDPNRITCVALATKEGYTVARTMVYKGEFIRIYSTGRGFLEQQGVIAVFKKLLKDKLGIVNRCKSLKGALFNLLIDEATSRIILPYTDVRTYVTPNFSGFLREETNGDICAGGIHGIIQEDYTKAHDKDIQADLRIKHKRRCERLRKNEKKFLVKRGEV